MEGIGGWLLVYLIGSVPVALFYATGLAGRFFDYHPGVVAVIFLLLAVPLLLVILKSASAPAWNIAALWIGAGSISLVMLAAALSTDESRLGEAGSTMATIVVASIGWAAVWTMYFLTAERVARTFH